MHKLVLSADEVVALKNHIKFSPISLIRCKAQVVLMCSLGISQVLISEAVVKDVRSIQRYVKKFEVGRLSSLFSGHIDNENASKLTRIQKRRIRRTLLRKPEEGGLPLEFWNVPKLKEYVKASFGVVYESKVSYHYLLKFSGLSFKYPDKLSPRRDEVFIKQRIKEIKSEIVTFLKDKTWIVLAADEVRLQLEAEIRKAWLLRGKRTVIKTERSNEFQNYLGFLNQKTGKCQIFEIKRGNSIETVRVLKQIIKQYPEKKVCVVWDNAKWHKGKLLRQQLGTGKKLQNLHLINFPPYAPETNPIEHVWQFAKHQISNINKGEFNIIKENFQTTINSRNYNYKI